MKRTVTDGSVRVAAAGAERGVTVGRVATPAGVAKERLHAGSRILSAKRVIEECI